MSKRKSNQISNDSVSLTDEQRVESWRREPHSIDPQTTTLRFQQVEIDYVTGDPIPGMPGALTGQVPIIRMWGTTPDKASVQCNVHGFVPYLYVPAPPEFTESQCELFRVKLDEEVRRANVKVNLKVPVYILQVSIVPRESIKGFSMGRRPFLKIITALPGHIPVCRGVLEKGFSYLEEDNGVKLIYGTYESNLPYILRFMIDKGIGGGFWIEVPFQRYSLTHPKTSRCQIEIDVSHEHVIAQVPEESAENTSIAPFRILSFDIECAGRKGSFPDPKLDPVIQIANIVTVQGQDSPIIRNVFNLNTCDPIPGADVIEFMDESELLLKWAEFVREADPDIIIGYNIANFDFPYLLNRAKALHLDEFPNFCKTMDSSVRMRETTFTSKAFGTHKSTETTIEGRVILDILQAITREHKLPSYTLNAVSAKFLGEQKEDVHHSAITGLYQGSSTDRKRLAVYCLKDAYLPQRLFEKLLIVYNYIEMVRVTGVPLNFLLSRGQSIKVVSQLYRAAREEDLVIPYYANDDSKTTPGKKGYKGATVIEPIRGYYPMPIATLDFASLYPSIMLAHNLSYDTLLNSHKVPAHFVEGVDYERTPANHYFVTSKQKQGILPRILSKLLGARKQARAELAKETDPLRKACLNGRQLALKISANSVYGFTGATVGKLPCLEISESVTSYGREMIELTRLTVEEHFRKANGYPFDSVVIYGDTDSVMVNFGDIPLEQALKLGVEGAALVTTKFVNPIKLEFEKAYYPYLLISKKRYAGLLWTKPEKYNYLDSKGLETVRRDNCGFVRDVAGTSLKKILIERNPDGAVDYVKEMIARLLQNKIDISQLIITKGYTKEEYAAPQAHIALVEKMKERDPMTAPTVGDRVPYVIVKGVKNAKLFEKTEDPLWVLDHNIPLDYDYYLQNQLRKPLTRIFKSILKNPETLFVGEHTRVVSKPTPTSGGIMKFTQSKKQCLGCRVTLPDPIIQGGGLPIPNPKDKDKEREEIVCAACKPKEADFCLRQLEITRRHERQFARLWTQCQQCQGSLNRPVICTSRDCPIFYMRKKAQKDVEDATKTLGQFESLEWPEENPKLRA